MTNSILPTADENAEAISMIGRVAIEENRRLGIPSYYYDEAFGDGIVKEMPDGSKSIVDFDDEGNEFPVDPTPSLGPK